MLQGEKNNQETFTQAKIKYDPISWSCMYST
jgi:hypothetical protein